MSAERLRAAEERLLEYVGIYLFAYDDYDTSDFPKSERRLRALYREYELEKAAAMGRGVSQTQLFQTACAVAAATDYPD